MVAAFLCWPHFISFLFWRRFISFLCWPCFILILFSALISHVIVAVLVIVWWIHCLLKTLNICKTKYTVFIRKNIYIIICIFPSTHNSIYPSTHNLFVRRWEGVCEYIFWKRKSYHRPSYIQWGDGINVTVMVLTWDISRWRSFEWHRSDCIMSHMCKCSKIHNPKILSYFLCPRNFWGSTMRNNMS